ncbi:MAG TPA: hypothetical protein VGE40_11445 [Bacilli bacterium]
MKHIKKELRHISQSFYRLEPQEVAANAEGNWHAGRMPLDQDWVLVLERILRITRLNNINHLAPGLGKY